MDLATSLNEEFLFLSFIHTKKIVETILYRVVCLGMIPQSQGFCSQEAYGLLEKTDNKLTMGRRAEAKPYPDKNVGKD